jgi:hypothetical protein
MLSKLYNFKWLSCTIKRYLAVAGANQNVDGVNLMNVKLTLLVVLPATDISTVVIITVILEMVSVTKYTFSDTRYPCMPGYLSATYGISRSTQVGHFALWILPLHKHLSFASAGDRTHLLISSSNVFIHVFLGLALGLLPSTSILVQPFTQPSSPFHSTCPNQPSLPISSAKGSTPILLDSCSTSRATFHYRISCSFSLYFHTIQSSTVVSLEVTQSDRGESKRI